MTACLASFLNLSSQFILPTTGAETALDHGTENETGKKQQLPTLS